jgi:hypothetical protein
VAAGVHCKGLMPPNEVGREFAPPPNSHHGIPLHGLVRQVWGTPCDTEREMKTEVGLNSGKLVLFHSIVKPDVIVLYGRHYPRRAWTETLLPNPTMHHSPV